MPDIAADGEWWKQFHVPEMADLFLRREDPKEIDRTAEFLFGELGLSAGQIVFDQCCGIGNLSTALARRDIHAIGVDLEQPYIEQARAASAGEGSRCEFHVGDAFEFVPDRRCHGAFNWYSSFGYAWQDERNRQMMQRAHDALVPGGRFALDVPHLPGLLRGFQRYMVRRGISQGRQVVLVRESSIDWRRGLLCQTWTWIIEGRTPVERRSALRLYLPHQIAEMLEACGFEDLRLYGSLEREPLSLDSSRLVCSAKRAG